MVVTLESKKNEIKTVIANLKKEYVAKDTVLDADKFKTAAKRISDDIIYRGDTFLTTSERQILQMYSDETINSLALDYTNEMKVKVKNGTATNSSTATTSSIAASTANSSSAGSATNTTGNSYDYDPYTENGLSIYPINRQYSSANGKGIKKTSVDQNRKLMSIYHSTNNSYSGCDMVATIMVTPNGDINNRVFATLGELQTISYSIYQDKKPVRVLGNMNAKDWVFGPRTIAGSLVFAVFNKHWMIDIYDQLKVKMGMNNWHFLADEIPPFTITISAANEYGFDSKMALYGIRLQQEGMVVSIQNILTETTYQFTATDIDYLDTLYSYQRKYSRHGVTNISQQVKDRGVLKVEPTPATFILGSGVGNGTDAPNSYKSPIEKVKTIAEAKEFLTMDQNKWNEFYKLQNNNIDKTKAYALKDLKTSYDMLKNNSNLKKATDQKALKEYYSKGCDQVNEYYKAAKKAASGK